MWRQESPRNESNHRMSRTSTESSPWNEAEPNTLRSVEYVVQTSIELVIQNIGTRIFSLCSTPAQGVGETDGKGKGKKSNKKSAHKKSKKSSTKTSDSDDVGKRDFIVAGATAATSGSQVGPKTNGLMVGFVVLFVIGLCVIGAMHVKKRRIDADDNEMDDRNAFGVIETRHNQSRSTVSDLSVVNKEESSSIMSKLSNLFASRSKAESEIILPEPSGEGEEVMLEDIVPIGSISVDSADENV